MLRKKLKADLLTNEKIQEMKQSGLTEEQIEKQLNKAIDNVIIAKALLLDQHTRDILSPESTSDSIAMRKARELDLISILKKAVLLELTPPIKSERTHQLFSNSSSQKNKKTLSTCAVSGSTQPGNNPPSLKAKL